MQALEIQKNPSPKTKPELSKLGFGQYFTDHMFLLDYESSKGWHSPRVVPYGPFSLEPGASVFHYGQALFEGGKAFYGTDKKIRLFRPEYHADRMDAGCERLCIPSVPKDIMLKGIEELVKLDKDWIPHQRGSALYLRPTVIGTESFLGVRPSSTYTFFVIACPVGSYYAEGANPVKIYVEDKYVRAAPGGLGATKAGANYACSLLAALEAKKKGYSQVLWLDAAERKYVEEVGTMNVFFKVGDEYITPPLEGTILNGATRDSCLQILKSWGSRVTERQISIDEVFNAHSNGNLKEVFGTGTAAVISPVGELSYKGKAITINNFKMGDGAQKLYQAITNIQYGETPDTFGWTKILSE